jgi:N,N'-diacetyllegionaminate synthase
MQLFGKDLVNDTLIVAEIGSNHEGSLDKALALLALAADAGVDAVKFQTFRPERLVTTSHPERFAQLGRFALSQDNFVVLAQEAARLGVGFFSAPFDVESARFLATLCPVLKLASGELTFEPVIRAAAQTGKALIISTGLGTVEEIERTLSWVQDEIGDVPLRERVVLLQCVVAYPTPIEQANVLAVPFLKERFGLLSGYSDHVLGLNACRAAAALGASIIEKHFTDQKEGRAFRDHELSADPADMRQLVDDVAAIRAARGVYGKTRGEAEEANLHAVRKGLVAARDLPAGTVLAREDIAFARPATHFRADQIDEVIGCALQTALAKGNLITPEALTPRSS